MTKEEAITVLRNAAWLGDNKDRDHTEEAVTMAIKALEQPEIIRCKDCKWWDKYGDEAMEIISTVKIAEDIIHEDQAIELAKKKVTVEYNQTRANFDTKKGLWEISFYKKNTAGGDQVITMTHEGKIIDTEYGE